MSATAKTTPEQDLKVNEKKWTKSLMSGGWTVIPNVIFERQQALGLEPIDINILLHIASYWWSPEGKPHPSKVTIATAIGVHPRTVQRRIARMEKGGFIVRQERRIKGQGSKTNLYHLEGLIKFATPYALEKVQMRETKRAEQKETAARKGKARFRVVNNED